MMSKKPLRRGVSELVIILALIAIIIPTIMAVQGWLSRNVGGLERVNTMPPLTGYVISRAYSGTSEIITIGLRNQGQETYNLSEFKAVLADGTIVSADEKTGSTTKVLNPGEERIYTLTVNSATSKVKSIIIVAKEANSKRTLEVPINLE
jgi:archaellum component FlaF (FlaF/FlaG flagellin family)